MIRRPTPLDADGALATLAEMGVDLVRAALTTPDGEDVGSPHRAVWLMDPGRLEQLDRHDPVDDQIVEKSLLGINHAHPFGPEAFSNRFERPPDGALAHTPDVGDLGMGRHWRPGPQQTRLSQRHGVVDLGWGQVASIEQSPGAALGHPGQRIGTIEKVVDFIGRGPGRNLDPPVPDRKGNARARREIGNDPGLVQETKRQSGTGVVDRPPTRLVPKSARLAVEVGIVDVDDDLGQAAEPQRTDGQSRQPHELDGETFVVAFGAISQGASPRRFRTRYFQDNRLLGALLGPKSLHSHYDSAPGLTPGMDGRPQ